MVHFDLTKFRYIQFELRLNAFLTLKRCICLLHLKCDHAKQELVNNGSKYKTSSIGTELGEGGNPLLSWFLRGNRPVVQNIERFIHQNSRNFRAIAHPVIMLRSGTNFCQEQRSLERSLDAKIDGLVDAILTNPGRFVRQSLSI